VRGVISSAVTQGAIQRLSQSRKFISPYCLFRLIQLLEAKRIQTKPAHLIRLCGEFQAPTGIEPVTSSLGIKSMQVLHPKIATSSLCYPRLGSETVSSKNGLSIVAVTGFSSLRDELPKFRRRVLEMIGSL
jgi:hypothetical protein